VPLDQEVRATAVPGKNADHVRPLRFHFWCVYHEPSFTKTLRQEKGTLALLRKYARNANQLLYECRDFLGIYRC
jgi:hypothetical protein